MMAQVVPLRRTPSDAYLQPREISRRHLPVQRPEGQYPDPEAGASDMPNSRAEEGPSPEEPGRATAEGKGGQNQDGAATNREKTFLEHARDSMDEHDLLGRLLGQ